MISFRLVQEVSGQRRCWIRVSGQIPDFSLMFAPRGQGGEVDAPLHILGTAGQQISKSRLPILRFRKTVMAWQESWVWLWDVRVASLACVS